MTAELLHAQIRPAALDTATEGDYSERENLLSTRQNVSIYLYEYLFMFLSADAQLFLLLQDITNT